MDEEIYQENILDHYKRPRNAGRLEEASVQARELNPSCGDEIELSLLFDGCDRVRDVKFQGHGCAMSTASASMLTDRIKGRPLAEVLALGESDILEMLGIQVGPLRMKCAMLPLRALRNALNQKKCYVLPPR